MKYLLGGELDYNYIEFYICDYNELQKDAISNNGTCYMCDLKEEAQRLSFDQMKIGRIFLKYIKGVVTTFVKIDE